MYCYNIYIYMAALVQLLRLESPPSTAGPSATRSGAQLARGGAPGLRRNAPSNKGFVYRVGNGFLRFVWILIGVRGFNVGLMSEKAGLIVL